MILFASLIGRFLVRNLKCGSEKKGLPKEKENYTRTMLFLISEKKERFFDVVVALI